MRLIGSLVRWRGAREIFAAMPVRIACIKRRQRTPSGGGRPMGRRQWASVGRGVVLGENVGAVVVDGVAPDGVDVVGVVLGVVVFDKEAVALNPVVVALALFRAAGPGEVQRVKGGGEFGAFFRRQRRQACGRCRGGRGR